MEKKVLTEILRIKELIGGKTLLNEAGPLPVNIIRFLSKFFKNETDDVVKKIVNASDDNIVAKLKTGSLDADEAALVIKNAGGIEKLYYNTVKETFNQTNYKDFFRNIQNWSKDITPERLIKYKVLVDKSVDKLLPNAPLGFKNQFKLFLNNNFDEALRIKNTPEIKPPKIKKPRKPKEEPIAKEEPKITTPTPEPDSAIKNLLNDTGEITEEKMLAAIDKDFESLTKRFDIPLESVNAFKEQIKSNIKNQIPADAEKSFNNMMKVYENYGPVEKAKFFNDIILEMNRELASNIKLIEKSTFMSKYGIKFAPEFFDFVSKLVKSKLGELLFGTKRAYIPGKKWSVLLVWAYMIGSAGVLSIINTFIESMIKTKNEKSVGNKMFNDFMHIFDKEKENDDDTAGNRWAGFAWNHCLPFASVIISCFKIIWHFGEAARSNTTSWRKDMSDDSDDNSDKKNGKLMEKALEVFKDALEEEGVAEDVLDAITIKNSGFIYTNEGKDYKIHNEARGKNAYVEMDGYNYKFTNEQFK